MQRVNGYRFSNGDEESVEISFDGDTLMFQFLLSDNDDPQVIEFSIHEIPQLYVAADEINTRYRNRAPER